MFQLGKTIVSEDIIEKDFICNLVVVRQSFIENDPDIVRLLVQGAARSGLWAKKHPKEAAKIFVHKFN